MVLDTYEPTDDMFIFKNTYNDESNGQPKQFKIKRTDPNAPKELFFVHIEVKDMANLPSQKQRKANIDAEIEMKKRLYKKNEMSFSELLQFELKQASNLLQISLQNQCE